MITIVSGASQNHFKTLCQFLRTLPNSKVNYNCYVYDLGLNADSFIFLKNEFPEFNYRVFNYSKYPEYYNINVNAGEYAWKPAIIKEVADEVKEGVLLWMDSGTKILEDLTHLINTIKNQGVYSATSSGNVRPHPLPLTHPLTLKYFNIEEGNFMLDRPNRNASVLGFDLSSSSVISFVDKLAECASIKECIAPEGSSRENHRQDQTVFTILYYNYFGQKDTEDKYLSYSIHNDID
jgi:hypothetical protein